MAAVVVSLGYLDGSTIVTEAQRPTSPRGEAFLVVSSDTAQRDDLRISLKNTQLVIFEPADGQLHGLGSTVPVKLLPKGSAALAGPAQIEAVQRRLSSRVSTLQSQNRAQQNEINGMKEQAAAQKQAVDAGLEEWAKANVIEVQVAQKKVLEWAQQIQTEPGVSAERRALAAFGAEELR